MNAACSTPAIRKVLLADIGGTNARFALLAGGALDIIVHMAVSEYRSFREALDKYLGHLPEAGTIRAAILAVSGPVQNGRCALTNNPWVIDAADLRAAYGFSTVRLINDFEAVAWALPRLSRDKVLQVGGGQRVVGSRHSAPVQALEWRSAYRTQPVTSCFRARAAIRHWLAPRYGRML
jgi:glucokinase